MSVLERSALEASPLADLHTIASELSIDGYRRLRKEQLIDAILARQGDESAARRGDESPGEPGDEPAARQADESAAEQTDEEPGEEVNQGPGDGAEDTEDAGGRPRRRRGRRGGRSRGAQAAEDEQAEEPAAEDKPAAEDEIVEGAVELVPNGSGFLRVNSPESSDDDIYISAAQVKRCELISGDRISGPRRAPRRSERFASLYRIDTVNGRPAAELADGVRFDDLPAVFPQERFALGSDDETLKAVESLTPIGKGSRVTIAGPARSGKTETLRRIATALSSQEGLQTFIVLAGVRPEEVSEWSALGLEPAQTASLAASTDAQAQAVGAAIDQARRIAARGADVAVLIDTLDDVPHHAARRALASARNIPDGGSLTVIATASEPFGGETTVIALSGAGPPSGPAPAIDPARSGTMRAELLVGE